MKIRGFAVVWIGILGAALAVGACHSNSTGTVSDSGVSGASSGGTVGNPGSGGTVGSPGSGSTVGSPGSGSRVGSPGSGSTVGSPGSGGTTGSNPPPPAVYHMTATAGAGGAITPASASAQAGATATFTVTPASGYAIDSVSGCGGSLSGSTYTAGPVSADCAITASFIGIRTTWNILHQPPGDTPFFYAKALVSKPLPNAGSGGPTAHLMPNSDAVIAVLLDETANGGVPYHGGGGLITGSFASPGANDGSVIPLYFGQATDPVYRPVDVKNAGPNFASLAKKNAAGYVTNLTFHAPNGATYSGWGGGDDNFMVVWDISGQGISNGKTVGFYSSGGYGKTLPACPGVGADGARHAGTPSDPCTFKAGGHAYTVWADPINGTGFGGDLITNGFQPYAAWIRNVELLSGHVWHATNIGTDCEATAGGKEPNVVFPASLTSGAGAMACTDQMALAPPNGSLFFLDYTAAQLDCLNPAKPVCNGADGKPIKKLDALQYVFIEQLTMFGGYEADTAGPATQPGGLHFDHAESSEPYAYYASHGFPTALTGTCPDCYGTFQNFFNAHCSGAASDPNNWCYVNKRKPPDSAYAWETRFFYGMPFNLPGPTCSEAKAAAGQCGVGKHLHIADPCVAVAMAGLSAASHEDHTWTACPLQARH